MDSQIYVPARVRGRAATALFYDFSIAIHRLRYAFIPVTATVQHNAVGMFQRTPLPVGGAPLTCNISLFTGVLVNKTWRNNYYTSVFLNKTQKNSCACKKRGKTLVTGHTEALRGDC